MARKIEVEIIGDGRSLERAFGRAGKAGGSFGNVLHKLGRSAVIAGAAIGAGVVVGLEKSVHAAIDAEAAQARLTQAFTNSHLSARTYAKAVDEAEASGRKLGFTDTEVKDTLGSLLTATHNYAKARKDLNVVEDVARFKHVQTADAAKMLTMAMTGSQRAAKQLGITVIPTTAHMDALGKSATSVEKAHAKMLDKMALGDAVIAKVSARVHDQAKAYSETAAGGLAQFRAGLEHMEVVIGSKFLPILGRATGAVGDLFGWLEKIAKAPDIGVKLHIAGEGIANMAKSIRTALSHELFGSKETISAGATGFLTIFHAGLLQKMQSLDWAAIGKRIGAGISASLVITDEWITKFIALISAHTQDFAEIGTVIALKMVTTLMDPVFWAHHWKIAAVLGIAIFGGAIVRGLASLGGRVAGIFFSRFMAGRIAGIATAVLLLFERLPAGVQRVAIAVGRVFYNEIASKISALRGILGNLPGWIKAAFKIGAVLTFVGAVQKAADWVHRLGNFLSNLAGKVIHIIFSFSVHLPKLPGGLSWSKIAGGIQVIPGVPIPRAAGGRIPMIPGAQMGVDSVPALLTPGEVVLNQAQQNAMGGPQVFKEMFGFAGGGIVKKRPRHHAPHLPASIREAEARARGTATLDDDIAAKSDELHWVEGQLKRKDLTRSERESLRVRRITVRNSLQSLRRRRATKKASARQRDYSTLPAAIRERIARARYENNLPALLAALQAGKAWLLAQLKRHGLTHEQRAAIYEALDSIDSEIQSVQDEIKAAAETPPAEELSADIQAQNEQLRRQLGVAQNEAALANAFVATGVFGGGGGGGQQGPGGGGGGLMPSFGFYELGDSRMLGRATGAIVQGLGSQGYRQSTRANLGV